MGEEQCHGQGHGLQVTAQTVRTGTRNGKTRLHELLYCTTWAPNGSSITYGQSYVVGWSNERIFGVVRFYKEDDFECYVAARFTRYATNIRMAADFGGRVSHNLKT